jgi:hypothetical protein
MGSGQMRYWDGFQWTPATMRFVNPPFNARAKWSIIWLGSSYAALFVAAFVVAMVDLLASLDDGAESTVIWSGFALGFAATAWLAVRAIIAAARARKEIVRSRLTPNPQGGEGAAIAVMVAGGVELLGVVVYSIILTLVVALSPV